ncbi:hypothetical protein TrVE_jg2136 [Triparma verrucosa]|uniref:FAD/NAD(P)-binding domain-containing protein n=1 Tax=Triparma verrucosa TaxID=1606542 RepID=A0A9W7ELD1_9STRA|nr:hypothetical protein TrVE_jg2136 [Triparma verrucosa]
MMRLSLIVALVFAVTLGRHGCCSSQEQCSINTRSSLLSALSLKHSESVSSSHLDPSTLSLKRLFEKGLARAQTHDAHSNEGKYLLVSSDVSSEFPHDTHSPLLINATKFLNLLLEASLSSTSPKSAQYQYQSISVIGAGPVGLTNAVILRLHSMNSATPTPNITVLEKRSPNFDRDVWFDVASASVNALSRNYDSLGFLHSLGLEFMLHLNSTLHVNLDGAGGNIETLPCLGLQRFLHKVLTILGVDVHFGVPPSAAKELLLDSSQRKLVIIADGANSVASRILSLEHSDTNSTKPHKTLIAHLKPGPDGSCPELRKDAKGKIIDPYFPGFDLFRPRGITSVFKRFFHNHCELQIFFSSDVDMGTDTDLQTAVFDVMDLLLLESDHSLLGNMSAFSVLPRRLTKVGGLAPAPFQTPFIVVGDAALSAHYRLGIGVNYNIFLANTFLPQLLSGSLSPSQYSSQVSEIHIETQNTMMRYIKFESECNMVLFEDLIFARDYSKKDYFEVSWTGEKQQRV